MPKQKDLKRIVRSRMQKTGESYTAARLHVVRKQAPAKQTSVSPEGEDRAKTAPPSLRPPTADPRPPDHAKLAGMSDASVKKATGRDWAEWAEILDAAGAAAMSHPDIARYVSTLGVGSWWRQTVTVGYERIRGLRERNQRRDGGFEANKSRTFAVPVEKLFEAFAGARLRKQWLESKVEVRSSTPPKRMRLVFEDGTPVELGFTAKGAGRSSVAVQHGKLKDKAAQERMKQWWGERLEALAELLG